MVKIPCPSCNEQNFDSDIICWKCGEPLHQPLSVQVDAPVRNSTSSLHDGSIQMGVQSESFAANCQSVEDERKTVITAGTLGALFGVVVMLLGLAVYMKWFYQTDAHTYTSYRYGDTVISTWYIWVLVGIAAVSGASSAISRERELLGYLIYAFLNGICHVVPCFLWPTRGFWRHFSGYTDTLGYLAALCGFVFTWLILRRNGQGSPLPQLSLPIFDSRGPEEVQTSLIGVIRVGLAAYAILQFCIWFTTRVFH